MRPLIAVLILSGPLAHATTYYVAPNGLDSNSGLSLAEARQTIQAAVDLTVDGDTVLVNDGLYDSREVIVGALPLPNRLAITNAITVQSINGPEVTIIEGQGPIGPTAVRCAYLGENAKLSGFTLRNGAALPSGEWDRDRSGGGAYCVSSTSLVENCILTGNSGQGKGVRQGKGVSPNTFTFL